jgi:hypothetical protein
LKICIEMDTAPLLSLLSQLKCEVLPVVTSRALNKTGVSARATAVKTLASAIGLAQKAVRPAVELQKARPLSCHAVLFVVKGKRLPLIKIDPRAKQTRLGVSYRGAGKLGKCVPHAFIATMPRGHRGIYARKPGAGRLPLHELQGPSLAYVFTMPGVQASIHQTIQARWPTVCEQELRWELQRRRLT